MLEPGDAESALGAASAVGDDHLQKMSTGHVSPESFTHGSSAQRMQWFKAGWIPARSRRATLSASPGRVCHARFCNCLQLIDIRTLTAHSWHGCATMPTSSRFSTNWPKRFDLTDLTFFPILVRFDRGVFLCLWWKEGPLSRAVSGKTRDAAGMGRQPRKAE